MVFTKVFKSGNSQAVRIPSDMRLLSDEVEIIKEGDMLIIKERKQNLAEAFELMAELPIDFYESSRDDQSPQDREDF